MEVEKNQIARDKIFQEASIKQSELRIKLHEVDTKAQIEREKSENDLKIAKLNAKDKSSKN